MRAAIMQPYFFPYIGYFQLLHASDLFVLYDNVQFTKKGWIHRNRILVNSQDAYISLPLKNDSDFLDVRERHIVDFVTERKKLLRRIEGSYRNAPFFERVFPFLEECLLYDTLNLFDFLRFSLERTCRFLQLDTPIIVSSEIERGHRPKGESRVLSLCALVGATEYINPPGGRRLYSKANFEKEGLALSFLIPDNIIYKQFSDEFVPSLSIIDVLMFNSPDRVACFLEAYTIEPGQ